MTPYTSANPVERVVLRVTLAFFNRYLLGASAAEITRAGNATGTAVLASGGQPPPQRRRASGRAVTRPGLAE